MPEIAKQITRLGLALAVMVGAASSSALANPRRIYQKVLPSVMTLEVENQLGEKFVGSAVMALADDVALTAWHVVADARSVRATFSDGTEMKVIGYLDKDPKHDLALLKLERSLTGRRAALNRALQEVATPAFVIGAPKGYGFSISDGLVSQIRRVDGFAQYQVSCPISPGNSGGPVLDQRGRVIGIVSWTKSDAQNMSFAIPTQEADRLKATNPVTPWANASQPRPILLPHQANPDQPVSTKPRGPAPLLPNRFEEFTRRLEQAAGKKITVIVKEEGRENSEFSFTVPQVK
jgi:S1-C subfamily serine protease